MISNSNLLRSTRHTRTHSNPVHVLAHSNNGETVLSKPKLIIKDKKRKFNTKSKFSRGISYDKAVHSLNADFQSNQKKISQSEKLPQILTDRKISNEQGNIYNVNQIYSFAKKVAPNDNVNNYQSSPILKKSSSAARMLKNAYKSNLFGIINLNSMNNNITTNKDNSSKEEGPYNKKRQISFGLQTNQSYFKYILVKDKEKDQEKLSSLNNSPEKVKHENNSNNEDQNISPYDKKKKNAKSSMTVFNVKSTVKSQIPTNTLSESFRTNNNNLVRVNNPRHTNKIPSSKVVVIGKEDFLREYKFLTQAGKKEGNITKENQDTYLIEYKINGLKDFNMFGVLDGHGYFGQKASTFVRDFIIKQITENKEITNLTSLSEIYHKLHENKYQIIKNAYIQAEKELQLAEFNCDFSGTTCVIVFQIGHHLICSNVGDSRAIAVLKKEGALKYNTVPLSKDHKPNNEKEKKRIIKKGGSVEKFFDDNSMIDGPYRVWIKGERYPGIAMSRSIGDLVASTVGVIPEPEFIEMTINSELKYILIASDGVWEFISNEDAAILTSKAYEGNNPSKMCSMLVKEATKFWEEEDEVIDDITVVTALF